MKRLNLFTIRTALTVILLFCAIAGEARAGQRIAVFVSKEEGPFREAVAGFHEYMGKHGASPSYEIFSLEGNIGKASTLVQQIRQGGFDLILTLGALATDAAVRDIKDTPIIAGLVMNTEALQDASNATGVALEFPVETQFLWMRKFFPGARTVGVLYNPQENGERMKAAVLAAKQQGFRLERQEVSTPQDVPPALERLAQKAELLWGVPDTLVLSPQLARPILLFSFRNSIPFVGPSSTWVRAGAFYSLDSDYQELGAQCAAMAYKVLTGSAVDSLPIEFPQSVKYSVNVNTVRTMKISVPEELIRGALHVYE